MRTDDKRMKLWSDLVKLSLRVDTDAHSGEYVVKMSELMDSLADECPDFWGQPQSRPTPHVLGDAAKFLAKLYLLGNGDMRSSDMLSNVEIRLGDFVPSADIEIPRFFGRAFSDSFLFGIETMQNFKLLELTETGIRVRVTSIIYCNSDTARDEPDKFAASAICATVFDQIASSYSLFNVRIDTKTGTWNTVRVTPFVHFVIDEISEGHIAACANCGRPIYVERLNAIPFCTRGHYNRYREKAQRRIAKGLSAEEVHEAFPALPIETIRRWMRARIPYRG